MITFFAHKFYNDATYSKYMLLQCLQGYDIQKIYIKKPQTQIEVSGVRYFDLMDLEKPFLLFKEKKFVPNFDKLTEFNILISSQINEG